MNKQNTNLENKAKDRMSMYGQVHKEDELHVHNPAQTELQLTLCVQEKSLDGKREDKRKEL
jgi:hypothetical protein